MGEERRWVLVKETQSQTNVGLEAPTTSLFSSISANPRVTVAGVSRLQAILSLSELRIETKPFAIHHQSLSLLHLDGTCHL
jgi:hypothetical protein